MLSETVSTCCLAAQFHKASPTRRRAPRPREVGGGWGVTTARDHDREPVVTPRAGSRRRQGKRKLGQLWPLSMLIWVAPILGGQLGGVRVPNQLHRLSHRAVCCRGLHSESDAGSQTGTLCYTAETPCPGAVFHLGTRLIGVGTRFAAPPEAHPKRRHRNDGDDIAWRIEPPQLELVRTLPHRPRRSLWAGGPSDNG